MDTELLIFKHAVLPMVAIVVPVLSLALIVGLVLYFQHRRSEQLFATVRHLAEHNQPVPPELLAPAGRSGRGNSALFRAISLLGAGVGLVLMFWIMGLPWLIGVGLLVLCIGLAQLLALWLEHRLPAAR